MIFFRKRDSSNNYDFMSGYMDTKDKHMEDRMNN